MVISNYGSNYNDFNIGYIRREIPQMSPEELRVQQREADEQKPQDYLTGGDSQSGKIGIDNYSIEKRRIPTIEAVNFAINADLKVDKTLIGADKDIGKLDMEKVVSDARRDTLLGQYNYFVGNISTEDGSVVRINNINR